MQAPQKTLDEKVLGTDVSAKKDVLKSLSFTEPYDEDKVDNDIEVLLDRRGAIISVLKSLRRALQTNRGGVVLGEALFEPTINSGLENPHRSHYSFRGLEKCLDIFRMFDSDGDGRMTYDDFLAYLEVSGQYDMVTPCITSSSESWLNYMWDNFGAGYDPAMAPLAGGGRGQGCGFIEPIHFANYRHSAEAKFPLAMELFDRGMPLLPRRLLRWEHAKKSFVRLDFESWNPQLSEEELLALEAEGKEPPSTSDPEATGDIPVDEFQLLMADSGEIISWYQGREILTRMQQWIEVMDELVYAANKKNVFARVRQSAARPGDLGRCYVEPFLAWFSACQPARHLWRCQYYLIKMKTGFQRFSRNMAAFVGGAAGTFIQLCSRGLITDAALAPLRAEEGRASATLDVGEEPPDEDTGLAATLTLRHDKNPVEEVPLLHLAKDQGAAFYVDLAYRSSCKEAEIADCKKIVQKVIAEHFQAEFNRIPYFHSWTVSTQLNQIEKVKVLRIAVYLKLQTNVDRWLRTHANIGGLQFLDLVREFRARIVFGLPLVELLDSTRVRLKELSVAGTLQLVYSRALLSKLLEEVLAAAEEAFFEAEAALAAKRAAEGAGRERTAAAAAARPGLVVETPLLVPDPEKPYMTEEYILEGRRRLVRGLQRAWTGFLVLRGMKVVMMEFVWKNLHEFFFENKFIKDRIPSWFKSQHVNGAGAAARAARAAAAALAAELRAVREENRRVAAAAAERRERRRAKWMTSALYREKLAALEKLKELGMAGADLEGLLDEDAAPEDMSPGDRLLRDLGLAAEGEETLLGALGAARRALLGLQAVGIQSGTNALHLNFQGFDIFELLPEWPPSDEQEQVRQDGKLPSEEKEDKSKQDWAPGSTTKDDTKSKKNSSTKDGSSLSKSRNNNKKPS